MMRYILVGILVVMAAAIGFVTFQWYQARYGGEPYGAPFTLVDQNGAEITEAAFRGHPTALFFGFTNCPEICPTTLFEMDGWLKQIGDEGKDIRAYFVSIDPERDTPDVMKTYVGNVSQRIVGITGEPGQGGRDGEGVRHLFQEGRRSTTAATRWTTPPRCCCSTRRGEFAGTIAYGESADTAIAKLKRLAAG